MPYDHSSLIIVDVQNDFCDHRGEFVKKQSQATVDRAVNNLNNVLKAARRAKMHIVWVRYLGDQKYQHPNQIKRDEKAGLLEKCREGTWGADSYRIEPTQNEDVVDKHACFDAFLADGFTRALTQNNTSRLILTGLYLDVCLDTTARTAYQHGYETVVLHDCTLPLHYDKQDAIEFMRKYYGSKAISSSEFLTEITPCKD